MPSACPGKGILSRDFFLRAWRGMKASKTWHSSPFKGENAMTGRERIEKTLEGRKIDRIPWTTIADEKSREGMPQEYAQCDYISF